MKLKKNHAQLRRREMFSEASRLLCLWVNPKSIRIHWSTAGIGDYTLLQWSNGHSELVKNADTLDQAIAFFSYYWFTFHRNVFIESRCTHPHEKCYAEYEGDREIGYAKQYICGECGGYIHQDMVDQFREEQHPELISPPRFVPMHIQYNEYED